MDTQESIARSIPTSELMRLLEAGLFCKDFIPIATREVKIRSKMEKLNEHIPRHRKGVQ